MGPKNRKKTIPKDKDGKRAVYECDLCPKKYTFKGSLQYHMTVEHSGKQPYKCEVCTQSFAVKARYEAHLFTHTGVKPYSCSVCNKSFTNSASLYAHKYTHLSESEKTFKCPTCDKRFAQSHQLRIHSISHTGERPFPCKLCPAKFKHRKHLNVHIVRKHDKDNRAKPYFCDICGQAFVLVQHVERHKEFVHFPSRPFTCTDCDQSFGNQDRLRSHQCTRVIGAAVQHGVSCSGVTGTTASCSLGKSTEFKLDGDANLTPKPEPAEVQMYDGSNSNYNVLVQGLENQEGNTTHDTDSTNYISVISQNTLNNVGHQFKFTGKPNSPDDSNVDAEQIDITVKDAVTDNSAQVLAKYSTQQDSQRLDFTQTVTIENIQLQCRKVTIQETSNTVIIECSKTCEGQLVFDHPGVLSSDTGNYTVRVNENPHTMIFIDVGIDLKVLKPQMVQTKTTDEMNRNSFINYADNTREYGDPAIQGGHNEYGDAEIQGGRKEYGDAEIEGGHKEYGDKAIHGDHKGIDRLPVLDDDDNDNSGEMEADTDGYDLDTAAEAETCVKVEQEAPEIKATTLPLPQGEEEEPYFYSELQCKYCYKMYASKYSMLNHVKEVHQNIRPYSCKRCGKSFAAHATLVSHNRIHNKISKAFSCEICGATKKCYTSMQKHIKMYHTGTAAFTCRTCLKPFAYKESLERHKLTHTEADLRPHLCDICDQRFTSPVKLEKHKQSHTEEPEPKYTCPVCNRQFKTERYFKPHVSSHKGCLCDLCGKVCTSKWSLATHKQVVHQKLERHQCTVCGKGFKSSSSYSVHVKIHTGEKRYACAYCTYTCYDHSNLKKHERTHQKGHGHTV